MRTIDTKVLVSLMVFVFAIVILPVAPSVADMVIAQKVQSKTSVIPAPPGQATITVKDGIVPVEGATVNVTMSGIVQTVQTGKDGKAIFNNLLPASYQFEAVKGGYVKGTANVAVSSGAMANGTIALTKPSTTISKPGVASATSATALEPIGAVTITVTDGNNPVGGVPVSVTVKGTVQTVQTNTAGRADFSNMPVGTYTFMAEATSTYLSATTDVKVTIGSISTGTITVKRRSGSAVINVTWTPPDAAWQGQNLSGATVNVTVNGAVQTATSDTKGNASFNDLQQASYDFTASKPGFNSGSTRVTVTAAQQAGGAIRLTLIGNSTTITVTDGSSPVASADISAIMGNVSKAQGNTDAAGKITFKNLLAGDYYFLAQVDTNRSKDLLWSSVSLTVTTGQQTATIIMKRRSTVVIVVTDGNNPISGADVNGQKTDAIGRATFTDWPGLRGYSAYKAGYSSGSISVTIPNGGTVTGTIVLQKK